MRGGAVKWLKTLLVGIRYFGKVNEECRKKVQENDGMKNGNSEIVREKSLVDERWKEYFESLLNVEHHDVEAEMMGGDEEDGLTTRRNMERGGRLLVVKDS